MNSRLDRMKDWPPVAKEARFQLQEMASILAVSARQLRRYIRERFKKPAKQWLDEMRADAAKQDFARGELAKNASTEARFNHASNFTRFLKRVTGETPRELIRHIAVSEIHNDVRKR